MNLYNDVTDRQSTQLAQRIASWPMHRLTESAKDLVRYNYVEYMTKETLEECIEEFDGEATIFHRGDFYPVKWVYGIIPTKREWDSAGADKKIVVEYRVSPAIAGRKIALVSWR